MIGVDDMVIWFMIGPIEINLGTLISFLIGIGFGFVLLSLIYIYAVVKSINKGMRLRHADETDIDEEEIKMLIEDAQAQFKNKALRNDVGFYNHLGHVLTELSSDIAKKFYPTSKYPYLELTVDESLKLSHYITDRLDEILKGKILGMARGLTLTQFMEMNNVKTKVTSSKVVKQTKKVAKLASSALMVLNAVNPVYWFRKLTKETAVNIVLNRIALTVIAITGEETYKIYSKKVFDVDKTIDTGVDDIYQQLNEDLKDAGEDA